MLELRKVTSENFEEIIELKVAENQKQFVPTNVYSIAQSSIYKKTAFPFGIYANDCLVGFVMIGYYEKEKCHKIWRLMIDRKYQGKGYGKSALQLAVNYMIDNYEAIEIVIKTHCEKIVAKNLYKSVGFKEQVGQLDFNQITMKLTVKNYVNS
ncbi:MAG: GNAT family N-acetyltransferase [Erysipelotrichaceae bacterium]